MKYVVCMLSEIVTGFGVVPITEELTSNSHPVAEPS